MVADDPIFDITPPPRVVGVTALFRSRGQGHPSFVFRPTRLTMTNIRHALVLQRLFDNPTEELWEAARVYASEKMMRHLLLGEPL